MCRWLGLSLLVASFVLPAFAAGELSDRRAPGFSLPDAKMKQHDLLDYRGKVVVVNIMKTSCPHCGAFSKVLARMEKKYTGRVKVLSIVTPPDTTATVGKYQSQNNLSQTILFDCGQVAASYLKITPQNPSFSVPHIFVIDQKGQIREDYGYSPLDKNIFEGDGLDKILGRYVAKPAVAEARQR